MNNIVPQAIQVVADHYFESAKRLGFGDYAISISDDWVEDVGAYDIALRSDPFSVLFTIDTEVVEDGIHLGERGKVKCFVLKAYYHSSYSPHVPQETLEGELAVVPFRDSERSFGHVMSKWLTSLFEDELNNIDENCPGNHPADIG